LAPDELQALAALCRPRTFERGEVLFHEGDPTCGLYILQSGQVKIVLIDPDGEETILHVQGRGECLGELSLVDGEPRSATVVALDRVEALALYREDFLALLDQQPCVERAVARALAAMVRRLSGHVQDVTALDVSTRLAKKLLELADRHGEPSDDGIRIAVPLTQRDLARMLGLTRASVNKHLSALEGEGVLTAHREGIVLHKPDVLRGRLAEHGV
jgi:CRP/FNR family transcriptional regulator/CRP/FNR family cyclic AMP-dependent transcriptional regulator